MNSVNPQLSINQAVMKRDVLTISFSSLAWTCFPSAACQLVYWFSVFHPFCQLSQSRLMVVIEVYFSLCKLGPQRLGPRQMGPVAFHNGCVSLLAELQVCLLEAPFNGFNLSLSRLPFRLQKVNLFGQNL